MTDFTESPCLLIRRNAKVVRARLENPLWTKTEIAEYVTGTGDHVSAQRVTRILNGYRQLEKHDPEYAAKFAGRERWTG